MYPPPPLPGIYQVSRGTRGDTQRIIVKKIPKNFGFAKMRFYKKL